MQLNKVKKILFALFCVSTFFPILAQETEEKKLPILKTKQSLENIRFISKDGNYTYYQRRSGSLILSSNFDVKEIISGKIGTQYFIKDSVADKRLAIERDQNFHTYLNVKKPRDIFITKQGKENVKKMGEGLAANLHSNDSWLSYFDPHKKTILYQNLDSQALKFSIQIKNFKDPYFVPKTIMLNEKDVLYTDINNKGVPAVLKYDRNEESVDVLLKSSGPTQRMNLCQTQKYIAIMEYGVKESNRGSTITIFSKDKLDVDHSNVIYQSPKNDLGDLTCLKKERLLFVKNTYEQTGRRTSEVAELQLPDGEVQIRTNLKFVSHIVKFDDSILIPLKGKYFVLEGKSNLTNSDNINLKEGS